MCCERQAYKPIINIFSLSLTSSNTADNNNNNNTMLSCKWNERKSKSTKGGCVCLWQSCFFFFVKILHFQHNIMKKSTIVAALQAQTQLTCSNFIKLEDRCMATHYFPCEAWRNKPCLQTSPCSALGSVFMLLSRSPASSHHTGDSRARLWAALRSSLCVSVRLQPETHE